MTVKEVIAAIQQHLRGQQNIVVDRYRWLHRRQGASESFDEFHAALMELTEDADVASMQRELSTESRTITRERSYSANDRL